MTYTLHKAQLLKKYSLKSDMNRKGTKVKPHKYGTCDCPASLQIWNCISQRLLEIKGFSLPESIILMVTECTDILTHCSLNNQSKKCNTSVVAQMRNLKLNQPTLHSWVQVLLQKSVYPLCLGTTIICPTNKTDYVCRGDGLWIHDNLVCVQIQCIIGIAGAVILS